MNKDSGGKNVERSVYIQPEDDTDDTEGHAVRFEGSGMTPTTPKLTPIVRGVQDEGDDTEGHLLKF